MHNTERQLEFVEIQKDGSIRTKKKLHETAKSVCTSMVTLYNLTGFVPPWIGYIVFEGDKCVGTCAFKTPPQDNTVEIAYFTFPEFEGQGIATQMAEWLVHTALKSNALVKLTAQTLPQKNPSNAILEKVGFKFIGTVQDPEDGLLWEWHLLHH